MTIQAQKIRLGAPTSMILFGSIDLGASLGGAELDYTPTIFQVECDQVIMPVKAYKTKEECTFTVALLQSQANLILASFGYSASGVVTTAAVTALGVQAAPAGVVNGPAGAVSYSYQIVAWTSNGDGIPSTATAVATGPATLTGANNIALSWAATPGAAGYKIIRSASAGSPASTGLIGTVYGNVLTFTDTGIVATPYVASAVQPAAPNVDSANWGGTVGLAQGPFDWAVPKNDGTNLMVRGHFYQCVSAKAQKIDYKREKTTEINKVSLLALADLTQAPGQYGGYLREEF